MSLTQRVARVIAVVGLLVLPQGAVAQQAGSIAGTVRDATSSVLPGVTVEASSAALIEKVRTATTDGTGQYRIIDLRPGEYIVTFTLPGFSTVRREGIQLTVGFTATVNAELRVGDIAETITVSGASPVVDTQNVNQQRILTREVLDTIPSGKQFYNLAAVVPGVVLANARGSGTIPQDVGGATANSYMTATIHGGRSTDQAVHINGMSVGSLTSVGTSRTNLQDGNVEEFSLQLAAAAAEFPYGGVFVNAVPKAGGNAFRGALFLSATGESWQTNNLDADLKQRGLTSGNDVKQLVNVTPSFGGPILRDKLWFHAAFRYYKADAYTGGMFYNKDPKAWVFEPDPSRPAVNDQYGRNGSLNLTWQASPKNKLDLFYNSEYQCYCHTGVSPNVAEEAAHILRSKTSLFQGTWSSPVTSRLLLEAGVSHYFNGLPRDPRPNATEPSILEQSKGLTFRSRSTYPRNDQSVDHYRASVAYVTGAHALKIGFSYLRQFADTSTRALPPDVSYRTLNGVPNLVTYYTTPHVSPVTMEPISVYAQEQWTLKRWTLNAGLRFDQHRSSYDAIHIGPTRWLPIARDYPAADVLNWKDLSPRLGVSWDVFGSGKTALKASLNRYILQESQANTVNVHPVVAATNTLSRTWGDANGDFVVQGDPFNPAANGELGPSPNVNFGRPGATLRFDPDWATGYGVRPFNWEGSVSVQHELSPGVAVNAAYFRRVFGNFIVNDNALVGPGDYDPYCITAPADARLPGNGGYQVCGLYDLKPAKVGLVDLVRTRSATYGNQYERWNGVDLTVNARLPQGVLFQGGVSTGKTMADNCDVVAKIDNPTQLYCHVESKFLTQVKFLGAYPLPWWGIRLSGTFQSSVPDPMNLQEGNAFGMSADYVATNAVIRPSLLRNLSAGANATASVNLVEPGTVYGERSYQTDFRVAKTFSVRAVRIEGLVDLFNLFNANPVFQYNPAYGTTGASWLVPQATLPGRLVRLGLQLNF